MDKNALCKSKKAKILLSIVLVAAAVLILIQSPQRIETVRVLYTDDAAYFMTKTAILDYQDARKLKSFIKRLKYDSLDSGSLSAAVTNPDFVANPDYRIEGENKGDPDLKFNYYLYTWKEDTGKDDYIVFNSFQGVYAVARGEDSDFLRSFLNVNRLETLRAGRTYYRAGTD